MNVMDLKDVELEVELCNILSKSRSINNVKCVFRLSEEYYLSQMVIHESLSVPTSALLRFFLASTFQKNFRLHQRKSSYDATFT